MSWVSEWLNSGGKAKLLKMVISIAFDLPPARKKLKVLEALVAVQPVLSAAGASARTQELLRQLIEALRAEGLGS